MLTKIGESQFNEIYITRRLTRANAMARRSNPSRSIIMITNHQRCRSVLYINAKNKLVYQNLAVKLAHSYTQNAWGRWERVQTTKLVAYCNYFSKKKSLNCANHKLFYNICTKY